ncbi:MAG: hypothetical protein CL927_20590 [Deltaproteobacteria bacterium]|nr:hypothetical protein [Deltaproteobacteria bacterium]HCH66328.1 hypothetical protein [Deltaproteobacteria bacterium]
MQTELNDDYPGLPIALLAVNAEGFESGNDAIVEVGDLPILQDDASTDVWGLWGASWRDVVVLDADNVEVYRFNLSVYDLANTANYDHLKAVLVAVAEGSPIPSGP